MAENLKDKSCSVCGDKEASFGTKIGYDDYKWICHTHWLLEPQGQSRIMERIIKARDHVDSEPDTL